MSKAELVLLVVIDGLRPDGILQARAPHLNHLTAHGACSLTAQTVMPSITLPTHMTMFHSLHPDQHGVTSNRYKSPSEPVPGLMELARAGGRKTAAFYSWEELRDLWRPGQVDTSAFINIYSKPARDFDMEVAQAAADAIPRERPAFSFVYLGMVDEIAHKAGWMTPEYLQAVEQADAALGFLLGRLREANLLTRTAILVQADHGGHDRNHGSPIPEDMTIPWILSGPGVRQGCQLNGGVSILDTAPTLAHLMDLPAPAAWQGRVIEEALE
jgi:predicted AlkP superfamily pyrophosphatase or phosphodiesterase